MSARSLLRDGRSAPLSSNEVAESREQQTSTIMNGTIDGEAEEEHGIALVGRAGTEGQGPFMVFLFSVRQGRIHQVFYQTLGCPAGQSGWVSGWLAGKTTAEARALSASAIIEAVGNMPLGREHWPGLAVEAVRNGLASPDVNI